MLRSKFHFYADMHLKVIFQRYFFFFNGCIFILFYFRECLDLGEGYNANSHYAELKSQINNNTRKKKRFKLFTRYKSVEMMLNLRKNIF